jgi:hypothetical protein
VSGAAFDDFYLPTVGPRDGATGDPNKYLGSSGPSLTRYDPAIASVMCVKFSKMIMGSGPSPWWAWEFATIRELVTVIIVHTSPSRPGGAGTKANAEDDTQAPRKLFDDRGNCMSPSFSSKNGVRYRFYVSTALRGRKHRAGSVARVSAPEIESIVESAVREQSPGHEMTRVEALHQVERVVVTDRTVRITVNAGQGHASIEAPWVGKPANGTSIPPTAGESETDPRLLQAMVRAHVWLSDLSDGRYASIEDLAASNKLHPKVVRHGLRLAFLSPATMSAILDGGHRLRLREMAKYLPLAWSSQ